MTEGPPALGPMLELAVPLWIERVRPLTFDERRARVEQLGEVIGGHGDNILFRSKREGDTAKAFNALAEALAILSFVPGGVDFDGCHFETKDDDGHGTVP